MSKFTVVTGKSEKMFSAGSLSKHLLKISSDVSQVVIMQKWDEKSSQTLTYCHLPESKTA